jgi:hypothetical protein
MEVNNMQIVIRWLMDNAYAAKGEEYWLIRDFPSDNTPDRLHIPIKPQTKVWREIKKALAK